MKDHTMRQAYDRGYDQGIRDRAEGRLGSAAASNPYRATRWGTGRDGCWDQGYQDGTAGRTRKLTQGEDYERLFLFHHRALAAFIAGHLRCDCGGISHNTDCPLGALEVPAEEARQRVLNSADGANATKEVTR